jgi:hypothetical protein
VSAPARRVGLVEACDDSALLNFPLWPRQRELLASVDAEDAPRLHLWALGRRAGKTSMCALVAVANCCLRPDLDQLVRPGEVRNAVVVATNLVQGRVLLSMARAIVYGSPLLRGLVTRETEDSLYFTLPSGARTAIRVFPCSSRAIRGFAVSVGILDEAAHFASEGEIGNAATADRVFQALQPATAQFGGEARLLAISTPFGQDGWFGETFHQASAGGLPSAVAVHAPSAEVNPTLTAEILAQEEARDPESYRQEFGADFLAPGGAYLDFARIVVADRPPLPAEAVAGNGLMRPIVAGLDPSFASDPFGVVIVGRDPDRRDRLVVVRAVAIGGRGREFEPTMAQVVDVLREHGASRVVTDQFSAAAVVDRLQRDGFPVTVHQTTAASKTAAYAEVRALLYRDDLEVYGREPGGPALVAELRRLRTRFTVGQAAVYSPRVGGSHGDLASALSLVAFDQRRARGGSAVRQKGGDTPWATAGALRIDTGGAGRPDPDRRKQFVRRDEPLMSGLLDQDL